MMLHPKEPDTNFELIMLLEMIYQRYGYDFREYSQYPLKRRIHQYLDWVGEDQIIDIISKIYHDEKLFYKLLTYLPISVSQMFRDPKFYLAFKQKVLPILKTYPHLNIWHAGCAAGEEPFSFAIMLTQQNLLKRSILYATDININALNKARNGIYPIDDINHYHENYKLAMGRDDLHQYFVFKYGKAKVIDDLRKKIVFSEHNLTVDSIFNEMNVIVCRNVLMYFNDKLKNRVLELFTKSLCRGGFLCLGDKETIFNTELAGYYSVLDESQSIYCKR